MNKLLHTGNFSDKNKYHSFWVPFVLMDDKEWHKSDRNLMTSSYEIIGGTESTTAYSQPDIQFIILISSTL